MSNKLLACVCTGPQEAYPGLFWPAEFEAPAGCAGRPTTLVSTASAWGAADIQAVPAGNFDDAECNELAESSKTPTQDLDVIELGDDTLYHVSELGAAGNFVNLLSGIKVAGELPLGPFTGPLFVHLALIKDWSKQVKTVIIPPQEILRSLVASESLASHAGSDVTTADSLASSLSAQSSMKEDISAVVEDITVEDITVGCNERALGKPEDKVQLADGTVYHASELDTAGNFLNLLSGVKVAGKLPLGPFTGPLFVHLTSIMEWSKQVMTTITAPQDTSRSLVASESLASHAVSDLTTADSHGSSLSAQSSINKEDISAVVEDITAECNEHALSKPQDKMQLEDGTVYYVSELDTAGNFVNILIAVKVAGELPLGPFTGPMFVHLTSIVEWSKELVATQQDASRSLVASESMASHAGSDLSMADSHGSSLSAQSSMKEDISAVVEDITVDCNDDALGKPVDKVQLVDGTVYHVSELVTAGNFINLLRGVKVAGELPLGPFTGPLFVHLTSIEEWSQEPVTPVAAPPQDASCSLEMIDTADNMPEDIDCKDPYWYDESCDDDASSSSQEDSEPLDVTESIQRTINELCAMTDRLRDYTYKLDYMAYAMSPMLCTLSAL